MPKKKIILKKGDVVVLTKNKFELTIIGEATSTFKKEDFFIAKLNNGPFKGETFHLKVEEVEKKINSKKAAWWKICFSISERKIEIMSFKFFQNKKCEYFPCHQTDKINCLFCFCPLYNYDCGGDYIVLDNGIKDCSGCLVPHCDIGYDVIINFLKKGKKNEN